MKHKHMIRVEIDLSILGELLGLPGQVVRARYDDTTDCIALVLEGKQFPEVYVGEHISTRRPSITVIPVKVLLNMSRGELAEQNLKGARVTQVTLDTDC